jgi:RNA polymerase sigma factor (sigma-70 family)
MVLVAENMTAKFTTLYRDSREKIYRMCCAYERDREDRQDLFQMIFLNIWKGLKSFRGESTLETWVYRVAVNTALVHARRQRRIRSTMLPLENFDFVRAADEPDPGSELAEKEQVRRLYKAINALPALNRVIVSLALEGLRYQDIASITGLSADNVGVRLNRIKKELADSLEDKRYETG